MKTLGTILLTLIMTVHIISKFTPVPFIGFAVSLIGFPFALKLSVKELFLIECLGSAFSLAVQSDLVILYFNMGVSTINYLPNSNMLWFGFLFLVGAFATVLTISFLSAIFMKLLSRFTPKRIKAVFNEQ